MKVASESFAAGARIPDRFVFGVYDAASHVALSDNHNPQLSWSEVPDGVRSFAIVCCDPDVPSVGDDVNQEGRVVRRDLPRVDFYHWVLVDVPAGVRAIAAGEHASGITARGKDGPAAPGGARHGLNDYTGWFAGDADMEGQYFGYDGPCPPWNDERLHRYIFTVYALDLERLPVDGGFTGAEALAAMQGHILAEAAYVGVYAINPDAV